MKTLTFKLLLAVSLLALLTVSATARERLSTEQINATLNDQIVKGIFDGVEWESYFATNGYTTFSQKGLRPSTGNWRAQGNQYCSQWPPSDRWDCYHLDAEGAEVVFVPVTGGKDWPGTIVGYKDKVTPFDARVPASTPNVSTQTLTVEQYVLKAQLPENFTLSLLNYELKSPRVVHFFGERLLIGSRSGEVYWADPPYKNPQVLVTLDGYPHSVVVHNDYIYIARTGRIDRAPYTLETDRLTESDLEKVVDLPGGRGHNSRTLKVGPDERLYVSLGIAGNCSNQYMDQSYPADEQRGGVAVVDESVNPAALKPWASGLRNPVGFDWRPDTKTLYATNNGPDHLGYEVPPEYLAELTEGAFFGMPWYQYDGENIIRDNCIKEDSPQAEKNVKLPSAVFAARSAPMDMVFLGEQTANGQYANQAVVALHGSWATSDGSGSGDPATRRDPKLMLVSFDDSGVSNVIDFVTGFQLPNGARWARPMGLAVGPGGDIFFTSDDGINGLFRLSAK